MASIFNTIIIKHGSKEPENGTLVPNELGYNTADQTFYIGEGTENSPKSTRIIKIPTVENGVLSI